MIPSNLKVLAKFSLCSKCSQKLDECSLATRMSIIARAFKNKGTARKLRPFDTPIGKFSYLFTGNISETL